MTRKLTTILMSAVLLVGGLITYTAAQTTPQEESITGSVKVPRGTRLSQDLADLAQVSQQEAVTAAQEALGIPDSPTEAELEVENGYLVWEVEFADREVVVDAGSGEVLLIELEEDENEDENEDESEELEDDTE